MEKIDFKRAMKTLYVAPAGQKTPPTSWREGKMFGAGP